jgi:glycosyltransferase involved in cell wall biosynthesis
MKILYVSQSIYPYVCGSSVVTEELSRNFTSSELVVVGEHFGFLKPMSRNDNAVNFHPLRTNLSIKGKGKRFFLIFRWLWLPYLLYQINRIYKDENCDTILATYPDVFYLVGAYIVAKYQGANFYSYFHNTYLENRLGGMKKYFARFVQKRVFSLSHKIFLISEGLKAYYVEEYGLKKFSVLPHSFNDSRDFDPKIIDNNDQINFAFIGNFNHSNIDATGRLINALKDNEKYTFNFYTHVPKVLLKMRGLDVKAITYHGFIEEDAFYDVLRFNQVCVLTHGFEGDYSSIEYRTIFPTRTIKFLLSGIPIFAHVPEHTFISDFLEKNECAQVVTSIDDKEILASVQELVNSPELQLELLKNARETASKFEGNNVAKYLRNEIK